MDFPSFFSFRFRENLCLSSRIYLPPHILKMESTSSYTTTQQQPPFCLPTAPPAPLLDTLFFQQQQQQQHTQFHSSTLTAQHPVPIKRQRAPSFSNNNSATTTTNDGSLIMSQHLEKRSRSVLEQLPPSQQSTPALMDGPAAVVPINNAQHHAAGTLDGWERELQDIMNSFNPADTP